MMFTILPLVSVAMVLASPGEGGTVGGSAASPRGEQQRLAQTLADADSIDAVSADRKRHLVTFSIDRAGEAYTVIAKTRRTGEVLSVEVRDEGTGTFEIGGLTWLSDTLRGADAVTRLVVDEDGAVTLTTSEGERYMAIPGRGSGGSNDATSARWGAEWNNS
ncbi:MAG: hypothetical protein JWO36_2734 [Myxococcales bacterium]|nr:hypothetical protein [Myxococcales bacterium]